MIRLVFAALFAGLVSGAGLVPGLRAEEKGGKAKESMAEDAEARQHDREVEEMKRKLGLSEEAAAKVQAAMKAHREAAEPLHKELKSAMRRLRDELEDKAPDAEIQATLDKLEKTHKAMQAEGEKMKASLSAVLTPTQKAKMLMGMMARMHAGGPGGPGGWMGHHGGRGGEGGGLRRHRRGDDEDDEDGPGRRPRGGHHHEDADDDGDEDKPMESDD